MTANIRQHAGENTPQPADQLALGPPAKRGKVAVCLEEHVLDHVTRVNLPLQSATDPESSEQSQIAAIEFEQPADGDSISGPGRSQESLGGVELVVLRAGHDTRSQFGTCYPGRATIWAVEGTRKTEDIT